MFGNSYNSPINNSPPYLARLAGKLKWILIAVGLIVGFFLLKPFVIVGAGQVGVITLLGEVNPHTLKEGLHFVNPIASVHKLDVRLDKAEIKQSHASTSDLQNVHTDLVVNFRIDGTQAGTIYKEFGYDLLAKVLLPAISESFKAATAKFTAEELITKRDIVSASIKDLLTERVQKYGLIISDISLVNFGFSEEFDKAIEAKVIATQKKEQAVADLERIKIEAQQSIEKARGEAESIRIQSQAIQSQGGAAYVNLKAIEKWDGALPSYVGGGNAIPFLDIKK